MQVFAFAQVPDFNARSKVSAEIRNGKSRFGMWEQKVSLRDRRFGPNMQLLSIDPGDWVVHVNSPEYGQCTAVKATGEYSFDGGIECSWGTDYRNYIPVDPSSLIQFNRNDPNIVPSVNLRPMKRIQRILQVADFIKSIENLKTNRFGDLKCELRGVLHLQESMKEEMLPRITKQIHRMNRSKDFELFLNQIFNNMPGFSSRPNGFGWRSDNGADLLVEFSPIAGVAFVQKLVVQAKSYDGDHWETKAVDQIINGIGEYGAVGGILITTANSTETLENYIREKSDSLEKAIGLIAGSDVARFVIRHAPEVLTGSV